MRRAMMTNRPTAGPPFTIGNSPIDRAFPSSLGTNLYVPTGGGSAPRAGTITSVSVYCNQAGGGRFVTGSWDGVTFTVTAVTADLTTAVGLNTFTVSLSVPSGGYVGWWQSSGRIERDTSGGSALEFASAATPSVGGTYMSPSTTASLYSIQGMGS